jgi:5-hydroxyisourate hydrolase
VRGLALATLFALAGAAAPAAFAQPAPAQPVPAQTPQSSAGLTTHVLDTLSGKPAAGVRVTFAVQDGEGWRVVKTLMTNADGRTNEPLLTAETMAVGRYRIVFEVGEYYARLGVPLANPAFLDRVPVEFAIADVKAHYHVPLLVTPWSYATYRGS